MYSFTPGTAAPLVDAAKDIPEDQLVRFNPLSPDVMFKIGDLDAGLRCMLSAARLEPLLPGRAALPEPRR